MRRGLASLKQERCNRGCACQNVRSPVAPWQARRTAGNLGSRKRLPQSRVSAPKPSRSCSVAIQLLSSLEIRPSRVA